MAYDETAYGEAADGRVRVELDDDGRLFDLYLDPRVAYLALEELRDALFDAFDMAQDRLRERTAEETSRYGPVAPPERLKAALAEASDTAERRFAHVSTVLYDLSRRAGRPW
jgi:DNA-binding protein YbaB